MGKKMLEYYHKDRKLDKKRIRFTIINDEGDIGVKINDIFNEWILIKNY